MPTRCCLTGRARDVAFSALRRRPDAFWGRHVDDAPVGGSVTGPVAGSEPGPAVGDRHAGTPGRPGAPYRLCATSKHRQDPQDDTG